MIHALDEDGSAIHVWYIRLTGVTELGSLSADEVSRAKQFQFERDRQRFKACHSAVRRILAGYLKVSADDVPFSYGFHGKPYIDGSDIRFNLSHSGEHALFAVVRGREVGVDVESVHTGLNIGQIVPRFLTPGEQAFVVGAPRERRLNAFLTCWTRKEAWVKAVGVGITDDLERFDVTASLKSPSAVLCDRDGNGNWTVVEPKPSNELIGAVVIEGAAPVKVRIFD